MRAATRNHDDVRQPTAEAARWAGLVVLVVLVSGAAAFWWGGGAEWFLDGDFERLVRDAGAAGPAVVVISMWVLQPAGLPGFLWAVPAGVVWPWPEAVGLCWVGNMGASTIAFVWARAVGREWVAPRLPPLVQAFDARLAVGGTASTGMVVALRLLTGQLAPADWLLGVSRVSVRTFVIGTGVGIVPGLVMAVLGGPAVLSWIAGLPLTVQMPLAAVALAVIVAVVARRSRNGTGPLVRRVAPGHSYSVRTDSRRAAPTSDPDR
jgi:uncharacterized membrane protein YdjX (TVP38/TMEM64 family)